MMPAEHFDRLFVFAAIGLGLLLAGGVNLALGAGGRRVWLRAVLTLGVCGAAVVGMASLTRPELAVRTGGILLVVLAGAALVGSGWFSRLLSPILAQFRSRAVRWGLVALGGLGVVLSGLVAFERTEDQINDEQMQDMEIVLGRDPTKPSELGRATTDRGNRVVLKEPVAPRGADALTAAEEKTLQNCRYRDQLVRRGGPDATSNCHGWVFTGGKFFVSGDDVETILKENGYQEVHGPQPGDLVIYRQGKAISHTAVVRYVTEGQPVLVEGKWGVLSVYLHPADKSFYGSEYTFHRSARTGHLLVGLGGSPGPAETATMTAE